MDHVLALWPLFPARWWFCIANSRENPHGKELEDIAVRCRREAARLVICFYWPRTLSKRSNPLLSAVLPSGVKEEASTISKRLSSRSVRTARKRLSKIRAFSSLDQPFILNQSLTLDLSFVSRFVPRLLHSTNTPDPHNYS